MFASIFWAIACLVVDVVIAALDLGEIIFTALPFIIVG